MTPLIILYADCSSKEWNKLLTALSKTKKQVYVVINPNDGPPVDSKQAKDWIALINKLSAKAKILYYVDTCFATWNKTKKTWDLIRKSANQVKKDIDSYLKLLPKPTGYFFDDYPDTSTNEYFDLEKTLNTFIVGNPGTTIKKAKNNLSKTIIFETNGVPKLAGSVICLDQSKYPDTKNFDLFYIHNKDDGENPYETLSPFIDQLL